MNVNFAELPCWKALDFACPVANVTRSRDVKVAGPNLVGNTVDAEGVDDAAAVVAVASSLIVVRGETEMTCAEAVPGALVPQQTQRTHS